MDGGKHEPAIMREIKSNKTDKETNPHDKNANYQGSTTMQ